VPIAHQLLRDSSNKVRHEAAKALGTCGGDESIPELVELLQSHDGQTVRGAILGIGLSKSPRAYDLLCQIVRSRGNQAPTAIISIGNLGDVRGIEFLSSYVNDPDAEIQKFAKRVIDTLKRKH
jgi:HEAT repeat protein